jgi:hypothetical protein
LPPIKIPDTTPPLTDRLLHKLHDDIANLPPVPPNATPAPCENRTSFDSLALHNIFGF